MPQAGRRSTGYYRPFVTCNDPKGVVECGTIRKYSKSNFHKMEPSNESRVRPKTPNRAADKEEDQLSQASFQLLEVSKGAQKLNHMIESWSKGIITVEPQCGDSRPKEIAKDLLKGALDLQESLMMLGKLQMASKYVARLKWKQEKSENSGFLRKEDSFGDESSRKKIEELREFIRVGLEGQNRISRRKSEEKLEIPTTSLSQSASVNYDEKNDFRSESKAKGPNVIAKLMGLEELCPRPVNKILKKPEIDIHMPKMKNAEPGAEDGGSDRKRLKEILDNMQFKGILKSESMKKTRDFGSDDVPSIVLMKPSHGSGPESSEAVQSGNGVSGAISVLKSLKENDKFLSRRIGRKEIARDSERMPKGIPGIPRRRGSIGPKEEIGKEETAQKREKDPPVKQRIGNENRGGESGKAMKSRGRSPEKASSKDKSLQQSEDRVRANDRVTIKPENRSSYRKREISPQRSRNSGQDRTKKEISTPEMQRSRKNVSSQQTRGSSESCGGRKRSPRRKWPVTEPKQLEDAKLNENSADAQEEVGTKIDTASRGDSNKLETNCGNEDLRLNEENHDTSEPEVGVSETCSGVVNSPAVFSPSDTEQAAEIDVQESNCEEGIAMGDQIKLLLVGNPSFLSRAEDLFGSISVPSVNSDSISPNERLLVDYTTELIDCRISYKTDESIHVLGKGILRARVSLDDLLGEIMKAVENLGSYRKISSQTLLMDGVYARMERDLSIHRGGAVSKMWDAEWSRGFIGSEDSEHVVKEVEESILFGLIEETLVELVE